MRKGWMIPAAGLVVVAGMAALRLGTERARTGGVSEVPPPPGRATAGDPAVAARKPDRLAEHALLLDRLRTAQPSAWEILAVEAAGHPECYDAMLRLALWDSELDERWKVAALEVADRAINLPVLEVIREYLDVAGTPRLKEVAIETWGRLAGRLRENTRQDAPSGGLDAIERLRSHPEPRIRAAAAAALWKASLKDLNDEGRAAFVRRTLEDENVEVFTGFWRSLDGVGVLAGKAVEEELGRQFTRASDPRKRSEIVYALGGAAGGGGTPALVRAALTDAQSEVRRAALYVVGSLKDAALLPTLTVMLGSEANDAALRRSLLKCVAALETPEAAVALARFATGVSERGARDEAFGLLQSVRGARGNDEMAALLIPRLERPEDRDHLAALAYALGCTDTKAAAEALLQEYGRSADPATRDGIVSAAFGMTQDAAVALMLRGLAESSDRRLKVSVLAVLSRDKRPELIPALAAAYEAPTSDADFRIKLIGSASTVGTPTAAAFLRRAAERETDLRVRESIERALEDLQD